MPGSTGELGPAGQLSRRVYARLKARYQAIGVLLSMELSDDAYTLTRGLMYDSQRLQLIASDPSKQQDYAVAWHLRATIDVEDRGQAAVHFGDVALARRISGVARRNRAANDRVHADLGLGKRRKLPTEGGPLAKAVGHPEDELDHVIASDPAHSTVVASLWHDRDGGRGTFLLAQMIRCGQSGWPIARRGIWFERRPLWARSAISRQPDTLRRTAMRSSTT